MTLHFDMGIAKRWNASVSNFKSGCLTMKVPACWREALILWKSFPLGPYSIANWDTQIWTRISSSKVRILYPSSTTINDQGEPSVRVWEITSWVQDFMRIAKHFRRIYGTYFKSIKKNRKITTCNRLDLETLGTRPIMPKDLPTLTTMFMVLNVTYPSLMPMYMLC